MDRGARQASVQEVTRVRHDLVSKPPPLTLFTKYIFGPEHPIHHPPFYVLNQHRNSVVLDQFSAKLQEIWPFLSVFSTISTWVWLKYYFASVFLFINRHKHSSYLDKRESGKLHKPTKSQEIEWGKNPLRNGLPWWLSGKESTCHWQETRVPSLVLKDPTCHAAIKPVYHIYWACALGPRSHNKRRSHIVSTVVAPTLQLEKSSSGNEYPEQPK